MPFRDLMEILKPIVLPIGTKEYTVPFLSTEDADRLDKHLDPESKEPAMTNDEFFRLMLGTAYDEFVADGVPYLAFRRASAAALADYRAGRTVAEILWETGDDPTAVGEHIDRLSGSVEPEVPTEDAPKLKPRSKTKAA